MSPKTVRHLQALPSAVLVSGLAVLFGALGALGVLVIYAVTTVVWVLLARSYDDARQRQESSTSERTSVLRRRGDRVMRGNALIAIAPPTLVGLVVFLLDATPIVHPAGGAWFLAAALPLILLSSAIDWYVILPFRDGITAHPCCYADPETIGDRRFHTKLWVAHRLTCEVALAAVLVGATLVILDHYVRQGLSLADHLAGLGGGAALILVIAGRRWIQGGLAFCLDQGPALGNWVSGRNRAGDPISGFVVDAALGNGLKIASRPGEEKFVPLQKSIPDITDPHPPFDYRCHRGVCKQWLQNGGRIDCDLYHRNPARRSAREARRGRG